MLRAILYISDSAFENQTTEQEQLSSIRTISTKANTDNQVSGLLAYCDKKFFHILEGKSEQIESLLKTISSDSRNKNISILLDIAINERIYDDWSLIETHSQKQSKLLSKFLQRHIDMLPTLEQQQHDNLELFVDKIFY